MASTLVDNGYRQTITAPTGGYASGALVPIKTGTTGACGIVIADIAAGEDGVVERAGVHTVDKLTTTGNSFAIGATVYRDASTGKATATATGNTLAGTAWAAATLAATTMQLLVNNTPRP